MSTLTSAESADIFRREPNRLLDVGAGHVAVRSVGSGPDVLFVHGWPVSGATYRLLLPHLVDHATCHVIDLPGAGSSKFYADTPISVHQHIESVRRAVDLLDLDDLAVVGHDSGGMFARHAMAGDERLRAMGLVNTEMPSGLDWRFKLFLTAKHVPGIASVFGWVFGRPGLRRNKFILGDAFADASLLEGEFDEFFLQPIHQLPERREAAVKLLRTFDEQDVLDLGEVHRRIDAPVQLVWGDQDPFFPVDKAKKMVDTFPNARIEVIEGAGLFVHEERPADVAGALLPTLAGTS